MNIHWLGDFANAPMSGVVISRNGNLLTILWDDGREQVVPEFAIAGARWRVS